MNFTNLPTKTEFILYFDAIDMQSKSVVGGKNASLGEMYKYLRSKGINIPYGFAITTEAYNRFIDFNGFRENITNLLLKEEQPGLNIRNLILSGTYPTDLQDAIINAYKNLGKSYEIEEVEVAVRSSAIGEDSETNSYAGQQDTYLNVKGYSSLLEYIKRCYASLFTDRVICYRNELGGTGEMPRMSVCIQKMVRSDLGSSGVLFTVDTESGFRDVIIINASYGLGETIVGGLVDPDEYCIFKKTMAIIDKKLGSKKEKMVYSDSSLVSKNSTIMINTSERERTNFCLSNDQIEKLGKWAMIIEKHYAGITNRPVDVEWAFDGLSNELYIVQARPITTIDAQVPTILHQFKLNEKGKKLVSGVAVGEKIASGKIVKMKSIEDIGKIPFKKGDVLVVDSTTPDWEPVMKISSAIITNRGGRTCHAAIIAREQGIAAIVGTDNALDLLEDNNIVTVSCAEGEVGNVYEGKLSWHELKIDLNSLNKNDKKDKYPKIMFNLASPELAFKTSMLPNSGIGLAREEFIINNFIKIHPLALLNYKDQDAKTKEQIDRLTIGYNNVIDYYVEKLTFGIAKIAAAFYPNDVIVRFSDFKSNEYRNLLGGDKYEPIEENPMIGWRGASRYYSKEFSEAFGLECKAIKRIREDMGLTNVVVMIPFCRTPNELLKVYDTMKVYGLQRGFLGNESSNLNLLSDGLRVFLMAEVPSNWALADEFSKYIDGFSIGSNDMTQLVLGLDRDSHLVSHIYDERNPAVKRVLKELIQTAKKNGVKIGICGQACSDFPDFLDFLVEQGIDSISITPDSLLKTLKNFNK